METIYDILKDLKKKGIQHCETEDDLSKYKMYYFLTGLVSKGELKIFDNFNDSNCLLEKLVYLELDPSPITKEGRWGKRFEKKFKEYTGLKLSSQVLSLIGNEVTKISTKLDYYIDFTNNIDWEDGEFGKSRSCWWDSFSASLSTFINNNGWAMRFYTKENTGIGRTWINPQNNNTIVLFNSYYDGEGMHLDIPGRICEKLFNGNGKEVHFHNSLSSSPYINNDKGYAIVINGAAFETIYDMRAEHCKDTRKRCESCEKRFWDKNLTEISGNYYCKEHTPNKVACSICSKEFYENEMYSRTCGEFVCNKCREKFTFCDACNRLLTKDEILHFIDKGGSYCSYCIQSLKEGFCEACDGYYYYPRSVFNHQHRIIGD